MAVSPGETIWRAVHRFWRGSVCASLLFFVWPHLAQAQEPRFFRIGTAATAGSFFEIGGIIAGAISKPADSPPCERGGSCGVPGLVAVAQATQGSVENLRLVNSGQLESGFAQADLAGWAFEGTGVFAGEPPMKRLRAIASLFPENLHFVVLADSPIRTLADLKGRRVSLGETQSGTVANARLLLNAAGLGEEDVKTAYLRPGQAVEELKAGTLEAFFLVGGYPVPAIRDLAAAVPIRLVAVDSELALRVQHEFRFYSPSVIPANTYAGVDTDTPSLGFHALWVVTASADPDLIHDITQALWNDATDRLLEARNPIGKRIRLGDALADLSVPLHPGAARYYREAGLSLAAAPDAGSD
jgi:TRAP transporter TAXI family solute receptor